MAHGALIGAQDDDPPASVWSYDLPDLAATHRLARLLSEELAPGDLVGLSGELGAGKTELARALVRRLTGDGSLEVPSPTFTLLQVYESAAGPVVHADFYRISGAGELVELGWDDLTERAITLVEWPERASDALAPDRLDIRLDLDPRTGARRAVITGSGSFVPRLMRIRAFHELVLRTGWDGATRVPVQGDASTRAYERLVRPDGKTAILMISPPRADGPPVRRGKPYSAIAKLAESVHAFVAVDRGLRAVGISAPRILGEELEAGLLLLEDFGNEPVVDQNGPIPERYLEAARLLVHLHGSPLRQVLPVTEGRDHVLPPYDLEALLIEVELLTEWYVPHLIGHQLAGSVRAEFVNLWSDVLVEIVSGPTTWSLRDFHSPNLFWLADRDGIERVGVIDFQDAALGHPAYDVVSLLQDARVTVPADLELKLVSAYVQERRRSHSDFDVGDFARAYAILGAQRATKILGIFARLDRRDGKPQYLRHLPRIEEYLLRDLAHPGLSRIKVWYENHLPHLFRGS
jgi:tRNA threonylcarbamoyl adenosine modification protein YjeE